MIQLASARLASNRGPDQNYHRGVALAGLWKLRQMGTYRVQMNRVIPYGWFVGLVVPVQEIFILLWLLWSTQYKKYFFLTINYFN
jgi:hypothetical protein